MLALDVRLEYVAKLFFGESSWRFACCGGKVAPMSIRSQFDVALMWVLCRNNVALAFLVVALMSP